MIQGLATDLKTVPLDMIKNRVLRTGDGSHKYSKMQQTDVEARVDNNNFSERDTEHFWGWGKSCQASRHSRSLTFPSLLSGDKEMTEDDMKNVEILHKEFD